MADDRKSLVPEALTELTRGVARELDDLLAVVMGHSPLMLSVLGDGDPLREAAREIQSAAVRGAELTRQLLTSVRRPPAPGVSFIRKPFTPDDLAQKVREVLDAGAGVEPPAPSRVSSSGQTPWLAVVQRGQVRLFATLQAQLEETDRVRVAWDRRGGERRCAHRPVSAEARRAERRVRPTWTWDDLGFVLVHRA